MTGEKQVWTSVSTKCCIAHRNLRGFKIRSHSAQLPFDVQPAFWGPGSKIAVLQGFRDISKAYCTAQMTDTGPSHIEEHKNKHNKAIALADLPQSNTSTPNNTGLEAASLSPSAPESSETNVSVSTSQPQSKQPHHPWTDVTLGTLRTHLASFASERDWEQYHTPRNLLLALVGETGELAELFQWCSEADAGPQLPGYSAEQRGAVADEMADVLLYLVRMADVCGVDLGAAALAKLQKNAVKYPAARCKGSAAKYTSYEEGADEESGGIQQQQQGQQGPQNEQE